jgi:hypothetical protein
MTALPIWRKTENERNDRLGKASMRTLLVWGGTLLACAVALAQTPAPAPPAACSKTITFAAAEGGQPVPAIPRFTAKWIGKTKHVEGYPDMCLSQMPSSKTGNYVVIFSTSELSFEGLTPTAHTYSGASPFSANSGGVSSYGGMWNYAYSGAPPQTATSSIDLQRIDSSKKLVVAAYDQQGRRVSHYSVDSEHSRERVLEQVLADIHGDAVEPSAHKRMSAPMSVYYVNCDVDSPNAASLTESAEPVGLPDAKAALSPAPPPPPQTTLELLSNPPGADIYLDNKYIGRTPFSATIAPGEHLVTMRKPDYGTWSRKLQVVAGPRKVNAYLEQKFLTLPSVQPQAAQRPMQPRVVHPQVLQPQAGQMQPGS